MYQPLTEQQFNAAKQAGFSTDQIIAHEQTRKQQQGTSKPGFFARNAPGLAQAGNDIKSAFNSGVQQTKQGIQEIKTGTNPLQGAASALKAESGVVSAVFSPLAPIFKPLTTDVINPLGEKLSNTNLFKDPYATPQNLGGVAGASYHDSSNPIYDRVQAGTEAVTNAGNVAGGILGADQAIKATVKAIPKAFDTLSKVSDTVGQAKGKVGQSLQDRYTAQNAKGWTEPVTVNKPGFNKATEIFNSAKNATENPHNIGETLTNNKINVNDHIQNGNYATTDTANQINQDAAKASHESLRPSLQKADAYTPKTSVDDVINNARQKIQADPTVTPGQRANLLKKLDAESFALKKESPQGLSLTDLHDNKITYDLNSKYDVTGQSLEKLNKAMADANRALLEKNAPPEVPVKQFNAELQKQFQSANYLDALNGKKVPQSILSRIAKTAAKVTGAAVGHGFGGGVLGGVGGYHIGGMIESLFENMPNPIKQSFLRNLEVTNPPVFDQVKSYLEAPQPNFPQLSAPSQMQMGPRTYAEPKVEVLPAEKQLYRSPTGQIRKGFKSTSVGKQSFAAEALAKNNGISSRPSHQIEIENALNQGNIAKAKRIVAGISESDPYKKSMVSIIAKHESQAGFIKNPFADPKIGALEDSWQRLQDQKNNTSSSISIRRLEKAQKAIEAQLDKL